MAASHSFVYRRGELHGSSDWNIPIGNGRLVKPMSRMTQLRTKSDVIRWVRGKTDIQPHDITAAIKFLETFP